MVSTIHTAALTGIEGLEVLVEVDICRGLPGFHLVGLPNTEVRESRERVLAALRNSGCQVPLGKITVNLAPAGVRKEGASFDLAIAMAIIKAGSLLKRDQAVQKRDRANFLGELSLFGEVRPVRGLLAMVLACRQAGHRKVVVPREQAWEASLVPGIQVVGVNSLKEAVHWWAKGQEPTPKESAPDHSVPLEEDPTARALDELVGGLEGMPLLRKAALVTLVGRHSLLMTGPPGTGKTRLAKLMAQLQSPLTGKQALDVTRIHSAAGQLSHSAIMRQRPFRAPHHSITRAGLIGGGARLAPGEVTLAHEGILFLDELAEFSPGVLDVLREPLEEGRVNIVRGAGQRSYPARFQLLAAMNPCRCGFWGSEARKCHCTPRERSSYLSRLSGPLLDRLDLFVEMTDWAGSFLTPRGTKFSAANTGDWRYRPRFEDLMAAGSRIEHGLRPGLRQLDPAAGEYLDAMRIPLGLSLRGVHRCLSVAGTLAVLDKTNLIGKSQVMEALEFRYQPHQLADGI